MRKLALIIAFLLNLLITIESVAVSTFTEGFDHDDAKWGTANGVLGLDYLGTGGADDRGYVSDTVNFSALADDDVLVLFRAQDEFGSSDGAFEGDWVSGGVTELSAFVRHNGLVPISFFGRVSTALNFPGAMAVQFAPVLPNTWTRLSFTIDEYNPSFVTFEGSDFPTIFSDVGHVQFGVSTPAGFGGTDVPITFDLDQISIIVPEPATMTILLLASVFLTRVVQGRKFSPHKY